jgi:hypothetical protein
MGWNVSFIASCSLAFLALWLVFLPIAIRRFTICSSIEMMKQPDLIREVVEMTQSSRMKRNWRLLTQFRSLWRDMVRTENIERLDKLPTRFNELIRESYELSEETGAIYYTDLVDVIIRLGVKMNDDQFRVFLKDCEMGNNEEVEYENLEQGIKRIMQQNKVGAKRVVADVLRYELEKKKVTMKELAGFLEERKWFMHDADIRDFLIDLHFNLDENNLVDIDGIEISS